MAKNKGKGSAAEDTSEAAASTRTNGALLFEVMDEGFTIPPKLGGSEFDEKVKAILATEAGDKGFPVVKIFSKEILPATQQKDLMQVYTRAKQLKMAAKRLKADITVAVRKLGTNDAGNSVHAVLAQKNGE